MWHRVRAAGRVAIRDLIRGPKRSYSICPSGKSRRISRIGKQPAVFDTNARIEVILFGLDPPEVDPPVQHGTEPVRQLGPGREVIVRIDGEKAIGRLDEVAAGDAPDFLRHPLLLVEGAGVLDHGIRKAEIEVLVRVLRHVAGVADLGGDGQVHVDLSVIEVEQCDDQVFALQVPVGFPERRGAAHVEDANGPRQIARLNQFEKTPQACSAQLGCEGIGLRRVSCG